MPARVSRNSDELRESPPPTDAARKPLTREAILRAGLRMVDQDSLEALTMRRLAQALQIDPMTIYRHFENKEALLSGLAEVMWTEVEVPDEGEWEVIFATLARSLRSVAHAHPQAYVLLCQSPTLPKGMLCLFDGALARLQQAGFERACAASALSAVLSYAIGYAMMELATRPITRPAEPTPAPASDFERIAQVMRAIPHDTPTHLAEVAYLMCVECDMDAQFRFGLDLMLAGLTSKA